MNENSFQKIMGI